MPRREKSRAGRKRKPPATTEAPPETVLVPTLDPRDEIFLWMLEGQRDNDIIEAIRLKWPGADVKNLYATAAHRFRIAAETDWPTVLGWGLTAYRDLYRRLIDIGDYGSALKAVKELMALAGKYCVQQPDEDQDPAPEQTSAEPTDAA